MEIRTEEIIHGPTRPKNIAGKATTVCEIFRYQPDNMEEVPLGNLYIVAELKDVKDCGHLNNLLASLIKREYYSYPQKGAAKSFNAALKRANGHLGELTKQGNSEWLGKLHFVCAVLAEEQLFLAQAGDSKVFLFRQGRLTDLGRKFLTQEQQTHPSRTFSSVISGKSEPEDRLIFGTPLLEEIFSSNGLRQLIISRPGLADISDQINKVLREQEKSKQLAILLLHICEEIETPASQPSQKHKIITPPIDLNEILKTWRES